MTTRTNGPESTIYLSVYFVKFSINHFYNSRGMIQLGKLRREMLLNTTVDGNKQVGSFRATSVQIIYPRWFWRFRNRNYVHCTHARSHGEKPFSRITSAWNHFPKVVAYNSDKPYTCRFSRSLVCKNDSPKRSPGSYSFEIIKVHAMNNNVRAASKILFLFTTAVTVDNSLHFCFSIHFII